MPKGEEVKKARSLAFKYLSYRDRSRQEIVTYLCRKGLSKNAIEPTMDHLTQLGYINDERFALNWGRSRISKKKMGEYRLRKELMSKGLDHEVIERSLTLLYQETDPLMLALSCAKKKLITLQKLDIDKQKRRMAQFLQRKGFSSTIVFQTVHQLILPNQKTGDRSGEPCSREIHPKTFGSGNPDE